MDVAVSARRIRANAIFVALAVSSALLIASPAAHATATHIFSTQGEHVFVVPSGVTTINVVAVGASGAGSLGGSGGSGAQLTADIPVTPGQTLYVDVNVGGGANGGTGNPPGNGGGESDVRTCSATGTGCPLLGSANDPRLIVAAGGGGAGGGGGGGSGGAGGLTGFPTCGTGGNGQAGFAANGGGGGDGATCTAGGAGGVAGTNGGAAGSAGVAEFGGMGGAAGHGGGGGGAGYFGGGGGGGSGINASGGGGGGGSSFVVGTATNASAVTAALPPQVTINHDNVVPDAPTGVTAKAGIKKATVSWTEPYDGGTTILSYTVTSNPDNVSVTVNAPATTAVVKGLHGGRTYTFTVTATNAVGEGPPSDPSNAVKVKKKHGPRG